MIATYVVYAAVVLLGGLVLIFRNRVVADLDALRDAVRDTRGLAESADRGVRRLDRLSSTDKT